MTVPQLSRVMIVLFTHNPVTVGGSCFVLIIFLFILLIKYESSLFFQSIKQHTTLLFISGHVQRIYLFNFLVLNTVMSEM